jgi:hypothetical protein
MKLFSLVRVIFAGIVGLALLSGCDFISLESDIQSLEQIEAFTGADLPADADDLHYEVGGFQDTIIWLRFDASPDSAQQYLDDLGFDEPLTAENVSLQPDAPETADWWITDDALANPAVMAARHSNFEANLHFQAVVDPSEPDVWRVYLVAFNT